MIPIELLEKFDAQLRNYTKGELLFAQNDTARNYYQVHAGAVKMNNFNDDAKEFIQGIFYQGQSFGEPPLFIDIPYPANAEAMADSEVWVLPKSALFSLLEQHPAIHLQLTTQLAKRLYYKAIIASEISNQDPAHRILRYFDYLKYELAQKDKNERYQIPHTRQQIADLLALRVETVIRAIKTLEKKGAVTIEKRKVYR